MKELLTQFLSQSFAMVITAGLIPGLMISSIFGPFLMVIGMSLVNHYFWDSTLFLSLPDDFTSHAIGLLFVNGVIFWLLVKILPGIEVEGIFPAIAGPVVFSVVSILVKKYGQEINWDYVFDHTEHFFNELRSFFDNQTTQAFNPSP